MNNLTGILLTIVLFIGIATSAYFANSFLVLEKMKAESEARYQCSMSVRYEAKTA